MHPLDNVTEILTSLRTCLCEKLEAGGDWPPETCDPRTGPRCVISYGTEVVIDQCCNGFAWVRLVSVYPSKQFPTPDGGRFRCDHNWMVAQIEMGVARCACAPDEQGNPPSVECMEAVHEEIMGDLVALQATARCCLDDSCHEYNVGPWTPLAEAGNCVGGAVTLNVAYKDVSCCDFDPVTFERKC